MNKSPTPTEPEKAVAEEVSSPQLTSTELEQALADAEAEHNRLLGKLKHVRDDMDKLRTSEKNLAHQVSSAHSMVCDLKHRMRTLQIESSPWCKVQRTRCTKTNSWTYYTRSDVITSKLDYFAHLGHHVMVRFPDGAQAWLVLRLVNVAGEGGPEDMRPGVFVVVNGLSTFIELCRLDVRRELFRVMP